MIYLVGVPVCFAEKGSRLEVKSDLCFGTPNNSVDYKDIDPDFGSMETFRALVDESHALGMKVLLDGVFNHTSDQHAWFKHARTSQENSYRNYYLWHPGKKDGSVPNGW
jgi:glycosidase